MVELTCPAEENIDIANIRKNIRYEDLVNGCRRAGWIAHLLPIEVGARGFVGKSTFNCLTRFGLVGLDRQRLIRKLSSVSARCSYTIYLASSHENWDAKRPLLELGRKSESDNRPVAQSSSAVSLAAAASDNTAPAALSPAALVAAVAARLVAARRDYDDDDDGGVGGGY